MADLTSLRLWFSGVVLIHVATNCCIDAFIFFQGRIPNGNKVRNPCDESRIWKGVGHLKPGGTGARNPFGLDFFAAGKKWTVELCMKDSDDDGRTNGEELGDPQCQWSLSNKVLPPATGPVTHPGVCEPIFSEKCRSRIVKVGSRDTETQEEWLSRLCKPNPFEVEAEPTDGGDQPESSSGDTPTGQTGDSGASDTSNDNPSDSEGEGSSNTAGDDTSSSSSGDNPPDNSGDSPSDTPGDTPTNPSGDSASGASANNPPDSESQGVSSSDNAGDNPPPFMAGSDSSSDTAETSENEVQPPAAEMGQDVNISVDRGFGQRVTCLGNPGEAVLHVDFVQPRRKVSNKFASFECLLFDFPDVTEDYYIIGYDAIIDNADLVAKVLLLGGDKEKDMRVGVPRSCWNLQNPDGLALWTKNMGPTCFPPSTTIRAGQTGFKRFLLQIQYYNPLLRRKEKDGSGIRLFYTKTKREKNTAVLTLGQHVIEIPGQSQNVEATMDCTSTCTKKLFSSGIHLVSGRVRTHALGVAIELSQYRDGKLVREILKEDPFDPFEGQGETKFDPEIFIPGGDTLRLKCIYDSTNKPDATTFGLDLGHEICFAFLRYYPSQGTEAKAAVCSAWGNLLECDPDTHPDCDLTTREQRFKSGKVFKKSSLFKSVKKACKNTSVCSTDCLNVILDYRSRDRCLSNKSVFSNIRSKFLEAHNQGKSFLKAYDSCKDQLPSHPN